MNSKFLNVVDVNFPDSELGTDAEEIYPLEVTVGAEVI